MKDDLTIFGHRDYLLNNNQGYPQLTEYVSPCIETSVYNDICIYSMSGSGSYIKRKRWWAIAVVVLFVVIVVAVGIFLAYWFTRNTETLEVIPSEYPSSLGGPYKYASVASDAGPCSHIGKDILQQNGSAVDSAIATILCVGVINMHSTGIGGGGFMLVYNRTGQIAEVFDFRETAPAKATEDMFKNASYKELNSE